MEELLVTLDGIVKSFLRLSFKLLQSSFLCIFSWNEFNFEQICHEFLPFRTF
jgi:hypothetical protein